MLAVKHSGRCADVAGIAVGNGPRIIQWDWWGGHNQQWRVGPAAIVARHSGKCLDVEGISVASGARFIQWPYWGGANQRLRLDPVGDGFYRIMVEESGKCLDVEGISTANGARIIQWEYWGGDNQKFRPEPTGDGYCRLVAKHSGKVVDVSGISDRRRRARSSSGTGGAVTTSSGGCSRPRPGAELGAREIVLMPAWESHVQLAREIPEFLSLGSRVWRWTSPSAPGASVREAIPSTQVLTPADDHTGPRPAWAQSRSGEPHASLPDRPARGRSRLLAGALSAPAATLEDVSRLPPIIASIEFHIRGRDSAGGGEVDANGRDNHRHEWLEGRPHDGSRPERPAASGSGTRSSGCRPSSTVNRRGSSSSDATTR